MIWEDLEMVLEWVAQDPLILSMMCQIYSEASEEEDRRVEEMDFKVLVDLVNKVLTQVFFKCSLGLDPAIILISPRRINKTKGSQEVDLEEVTMIFSIGDLIILEFINFTNTQFFNR